ncbi:carbohydrate ABC transporter permease [Spirochaeta isovalerica]|uniref:Raffinose/stachyose/melibiose transport system permease protein n=1 Tax=Spirochaeta isovalerica TaxID=150 RepID=A0A841R8T4_9SPIO|nr:sugar ABC transporter permease [Spirochaeta isovalerica]MBB6481694.1 raffinose/stachyose/melibiose transport system permease protein [Spirochaeta isovalerica]
MNQRDRKALMFYIGMVAPGLAIYLSIVAYPVFYSVWLSFTDFNPNAGGVGNFMGLFHYKAMLDNPEFWHSLKNNMIVVAVSVFGQIPIGFILAYILYRKMVRAEKFFQSMVFLPQFLSTIVIGILWKRLFVADGPVSTIMQLATGDPSAQFDLMLRAETVMIPIGIALIWMYTGFYMVIFLANLQKMNVNMIEAAKIDGATEPQIFGRIILPLLTGTIIVSSVLAIAGSLKGFDLIFAMTTQGLQRDNASVLPIYMYETAFRDYSNPMRFAYGAAISNAIVAISIVMIGISNWIGKHMSQDEVY